MALLEGGLLQARERSGSVSAELSSKSKKHITLQKIIPDTPTLAL
jgi:hypothetical protein